MELEFGQSSWGWGRGASHFPTTCLWFPLSGSKQLPVHCLWLPQSCWPLTKCQAHRCFSRETPGVTVKPQRHRIQQAPRDALSGLADSLQWPWPGSPRAWPPWEVIPVVGFADLGHCTHSIHLGTSCPALVGFAPGSWILQADEQCPGHLSSCHRHCSPASAVGGHGRVGSP